MFPPFRPAALLAAACVAICLCGPLMHADGQVPVAARPASPSAGRDVFRFATFGTEGFWTDAVRLPQGLAGKKVTPLGALDMGLSLDADAIPADLKATLVAEFGTDRTAANAPKLNDPATTARLIEANAVIGLVPVAGKLGISCALCHTITDASVYDALGKGSVGRRLDTRTSHVLNIGELFATAANSRALYPILQLQDGDRTIGRAPRGLTAASTEEDVDAYLSNPESYPVGTLDATSDGHGNSTVIMPVFRQDLAARFGSPGESDTFADSSNRTYTTLLDLTIFLTPEGRKFTAKTGGAAGTKILDDYEKILKETGVEGYPFLKATIQGEVGKSPTPLGRRVDEAQLADLTAFCQAVQAPAGVAGDPGAVARGRALFQGRCTACHGENALQPVPPTVVDLGTLWPGYAPRVMLARELPLTALQDSPGTYDDHVVSTDASGGGKPRGFALPLLLDLGRKPILLHDGSVKGLGSLLDPARGPAAPHPVYVSDDGARADLVAFLRSLGSTSSPASAR